MKTYEDLNDEKDCDRCGYVWYQCKCSHQDVGEEQCVKCQEWFDPGDLNKGMCDKCLRAICPAAIILLTIDKLDDWKEFLEWRFKVAFSDSHTDAEDILKETFTGWVNNDCCGRQENAWEDLEKYTFEEAEDTSTYKDILRDMIAERTRE